MACLLDEEGELAGLLTDGDLKRALLRGDAGSLMDEPVARFASMNPRTVDSGLLASEALTMMEANQPGPITGLVVTGPDGAVLGLIHIHDILRAGLEKA